MASTGSETYDDSNEELCTIEASVVTGFEESARGEAREKFGTEVKAARGKITWKVPLERVKDVVKMGSIDNCRVVMYSSPHFKFTDQHESLARLQKLVRDIDWESGLKVWQRFYTFPHPIASCPEVIPDPEDLVDVVIITRQPPAKSKEEKKSRKGGRGKKKEKRKGKGKQGPEKDEADEDVLAGETAKMVSEDTLLGSEVKSPSENELRSDDKSSKSVNEKGDAALQLGNDSSSLSERDPRDHDAAEVIKSCEPETTDETSSASQQGSSSASASTDCKEVKFSLEPKTVIVKRAQPGQAEPPIDIKVLIPGPDAFPTDIKPSDQRVVEPMDIDHSSPKKVLSPSKALESDEVVNKGITSETKDKERQTDTPTDTNDSELQAPDGAKQGPVSENGSTSAEFSVSEFASSVIKKLTSPPQSPVKETGSGGISPSDKVCVTPPPTPVASVGNPFSLIQDRLNAELTPFINDIDRPKAMPDQQPSSVDTGSSVDPPYFSEKLESEKGSLPTTVQSENVISTANATAMPTSVSSVPLSSADLKPCAGETGRIEESSALGDEITENLERKCIEDEKLSKERGDLIVETPPVKKERDPTKPTFRVTCNRVGDNHTFDSSSAAASFGSAIITYFNWSVDLKNFDIEVLLNIDNEEVTVSIALTKTSLHNRNLVAFGPTTLRATICYNMLRLCRIKNGDFICDPMCGTSAIPIEGALNWTNCYHFGGDIHEKAIERTTQNIAAVQKKIKEENKGALKVDAVQWNIQHFPLRDKCVDVFVSDLPFGHRMGSRTVNRTLYPCLLSEMARTARSGARACLLTEDKTSLIKAIQTLGKYWQRRLVLSINIGGLSGFVFLLTRTTSFMAPSAGSWRGNQAQTTDGEAEEKEVAVGDSECRDTESSSGAGASSPLKDNHAARCSDEVGSSSAASGVESSLPVETDGADGDFCEQKQQE